MSAPTEIKHLHPTLPSNSTRWSRKKSITTEKRIIPSVLCSAQAPSANLPEGWCEFVQPEGQLYFYHRRSRVVTDTNIRLQEKRDLVDEFILVLKGVLKEKDVKISETMDIMFQLEEDDEFGYYIADHKSCTIKWLQDVASDEVGLGRPSSEVNLGWLLTEQYWSHVEYFPSHLAGIGMESVQELIGVLVHAEADHLTSSVGTFPYHVEQCGKFLELLRHHVSPSSQLLTDRYVICVTARLWSQVARNRAMNFYGEECARLSRGERLDSDGPKGNPRFVRFLEKALLFGIPSKYASDLDDLWADGFVYNHTSEQYALHFTKEWKENGFWALGIACLNVLLCHLMKGSQPFTMASLLCSAISFVLSLLFVVVIGNPVDFKIERVLNFFISMDHPVYGLAPLSIVCSLPKALLVWSSGLMSLQIFVSFVYPLFTLDFNNPIGFSFTLFSAVCTIIVLFAFAYRFLRFRLSSLKTYSWLKSEKRV